MSTQPYKRALSVYLPMRCEGFDARHYDLVIGHLVRGYRAVWRARIAKSWSVRFRASALGSSWSAGRISWTGSVRR